MCTEDVLRAYLQSASELLRGVYLRPNRQFHVPAGYVLKLLYPLNGLDGSGDDWHTTFSNHLTDDFGVKAVASDMPLFLRPARGKNQVYLQPTWMTCLLVVTRPLLNSLRKLERKLK